MEWSAQASRACDPNDSVILGPPAKPDTRSETLAHQYLPGQPSKKPMVQGKHKI